MRKIEKPSPTESPLLFEFDPKPAEKMLTALGGLPLVVQAFRSLGLPGSVKQHLVVKERQRGYDEARLAVIAYNVLTALKRLALQANLLTARPKRLRFLIFHMPGRLVHHARQLSLRLGTAIEELAMCLDAVRLLPLPS